ncbi:MAG: phenylacetate--CoA ligase family protein [Candidatus Cyclobacteriaceae bacterium M2_1C_046]
MIPDIEKASVEEIKKFQENQLRLLLQYVNDHSVFYKRYFKEHNINFKKINTLENLSLIPPVDKFHLQKFNKDFYCVERKKIIDFCNTSGTEGEAVTIPLSEKDVERLTYNEALSLTCAGGSDEEVYQLTTTVDRRFMAGLAYVLGARKIEAGMVRVGPKIPELHWKTIEEIEPTALIIVPSFLLKLIEYAEAHNIDYRNSSIKKAICIGEPIRNNDLSLNALGARIREKWDIQLFSTYASSEMATAFTECEEGCGGHTHPELIITEILDDNNNPVPDGEPGELTITTLGVEAMPLIRFKTGDILCKHTEKCNCGRTTYRLGPVIGRKHQMIKYKGTTIYPPAIFEVMNDTPHIIDYVVEVSTNEYNTDEVQIHYAAGEALNLPELIDHFKTKVRVTPKLIPTPMDDLRKILFPEMSRKPVKFIDNRSTALKI